MAKFVWSEFSGFQFRHASIYIYSDSKNVMKYSQVSDSITFLLPAT